MHIAIRTLDGYNELDSIVALGILNRVRRPGWRVSLAAPTPTVTSMNGVAVHAQRSGTLLLAKLGLLGSGADRLPACTDLLTQPWVQEAGVDALNQPYFAHVNVARLAGTEEARAALHCVGTVGEKGADVAAAMARIAPYLMQPQPAARAA